MRRVVLAEPFHLELCDVSLPASAPGEALVRVCVTALHAPAACAACQPGFMAAKLKPAARRKSLEPEVNKNAPEVFVVFFHAVVQRANVPLIQEAQHSLF